MTILVVDDSEEVRDIVEAVLADAGYQDVISLDSGPAALSYLSLNSKASANPRSLLPSSPSWRKDRDSLAASL